jgi:CheY-like chemotaxis protein
MPETTVLLVEDNDGLRQLYELMLQLAGYAVRAVETAPKAISELEHYLPDLLITDLALPGMNGIDLIRHIRSSPDSSELPILAITAFGEGFQSLAMTSGATKILAKPFTDDELRDALIDVLPKK